MIIKQMLERNRQMIDNIVNEELNYLYTRVI